MSGRDGTRRVVVSGLIYDPRVARENVKEGKKGGEFFEGWLETEGGVVVEVGEGKRKGDAEGIVLPLLVNAHTHLADGFIVKEMPLTLFDAVAPPAGLKHRELVYAGEKALVETIKKGLMGFSEEGVGLVADYREGGIRGVEIFKKAEDALSPAHPATNMEALVLGRPETGIPGSTLGGDREEGVAENDVVENAKRILRVADGLGLPETAIYELEDLKKMRAHARGMDRLFSFHWAEEQGEDVGVVEKLRPDFVVHAVHASMDDFEVMQKIRCGVVVCPVMNAFFGETPDAGAMLDAGLDVGLGTDNAMAGSSMFETMRWTYILSRHQARNRRGKRALSPSEVLYMAVLGGRKVLRREKTFPLLASENTAEDAASFVVVRRPSECSEGDAANVVVTRTSTKDVLYVQRGEKIWKNTNVY